MPHWLRIVITGICFAIFFGGSPFLALVVFPWLRLTSRDREHFHERTTYVLHRGTRHFIRFVNAVGMIRAPLDVALPPGVDPTKPYVLIANHPTLIDIVLSLAWFPGLTCVAKGGWYSSFVLGPLLRSTNYVPGPGAGDDEAEDLLGAMTSHVERGFPLMIFPEGTRSKRGNLNRFRRGAFEVAFAAGVPLVPMYIDVDRPYLMKGMPFWKVEKIPPRFSAEFFDIVEPATEPGTAKDALARLTERYRARFARTLALRAGE